jgi:hypothetical protein
VAAEDVTLLDVRDGRRQLGQTTRRLQVFHIPSVLNSLYFIHFKIISCSIRYKKLPYSIRFNPFDISPVIKKIPYSTRFKSCTFHPL